MSTLLHPKLARELARARLEGLRNRSISELTESVDLLLPGHTFDPIGGRQVTVREIGDLRATSLEIAEQSGFPNRGGVDQRVLFDGEMGRLLHEHMAITPHQAADEEVWTHLTIGPLIDIAGWRFDGLPDDRAIGRAPRNTFRRLWWRAEILGELSWDQERPLREDETVQIMERPELSGNPVVARALAEAFHRRVATSPGVPRMNLMRDGLKRAYRLTPFLGLRDSHTRIFTAYSTISSLRRRRTSTPARPTMMSGRPSEMSARRRVPR